MKYLFRASFILLLIFILGVLLLLGYLGLLGSWSKSLGVDQPKNLGVEYDSYDLAIGQEKADVGVGKLQPIEETMMKIRYSGEHRVDEIFTDRELTGLANRGNWEYYPLSGVQIHINSDGSVEVSGFIKTERLIDYLVITGNPSGLGMDVLRLLCMSRGKIPFYIDGKVEVQNNKVSLDLKKVVFGRLSIPKKIIADSQSSFEYFVEERIRFVKGLSIQSLIFAEGEMRFVGTLPDEELI